MISLLFLLSRYFFKDIFACFNKQNLFNYCVKNNIIPMIKILLPHVNPNDNNNYAIRHVVNNNCIKTCRILVSDYRTDILFDRCYAFRQSDQKNYFDILAILLDSIDPNININRQPNIALMTLIKL